MEWISVKDRLPQTLNSEDGCVSVLISYGKDGFGMPMILNVLFDGYKNEFFLIQHIIDPLCWETKRIIFSPTHWMPLPKPPMD